MACILIPLYIVLGIFFWLMPMIDILRSAEGDFRQPTDRVLWFIIVLAIPPFGGIAYLITKPNQASDGRGQPPLT